MASVAQGTNTLLPQDTTPGRSLVQIQVVQTTNTPLLLDIRILSSVSPGAGQRNQAQWGQDDAPEAWWEEREAYRWVHTSTHTWVHTSPPRGDQGPTPPTRPQGAAQEGGKKRTLKKIPFFKKSSQLNKCVKCQPWTSIPQMAANNNPDELINHVGPELQNNYHHAEILPRNYWLLNPWNLNKVIFIPVVGGLCQHRINYMTRLEITLNLGPFRTSLSPATSLNSHPL